MEPIYRSDGQWVAVYEKGHLHNVDGEWLGFVIGREVFDPGGLYVGFLSDDRRLLRKRALSDDPPRVPAPPEPGRLKTPGNVPLAPLLRELPFQIIDVFAELPERIAFISETRPDMD